MYEISVPVFVGNLENLKALLRKGADHAALTNTSTEALLQRSLHPDMYSLAQQVRAAIYHASAATASLLGREPPQFDPGAAQTDLTTLLAEIEACIARLGVVERQQFDDAAGRTITLKLRRGTVVLGAQQYLTRFAMPNFFFHVVTAYDILRQSGVPIGKADFLGSLV